MQNKAVELESQLVKMLEYRPKYTALTLGWLDEHDIYDDKIRDVWSAARQNITRDMDEYDARNVVSDAIIEAGLDDNPNRYHRHDYSQNPEHTPDALAHRITKLAYG